MSLESITAHMRSAAAWQAAGAAHAPSARMVLIPAGSPHPYEHGS